MKRRVVDIHPHVISTDTRAYPRDPLWGRPSVWSQERPASTEQLLQAMDEAGVARDMLVADAPARMRHWVGRGLTGLRLFTAGSTVEGQVPGLDDPRSFPAWDCAADLGLPVCVQMRIAGVPQLRVLLARYPRVPIVLDHFFALPLDEGPPYASAQELFRLAAHPNVHLKLTPVILAKAHLGQASPQSFFGRALAEFGAARIAWGSNFPATAGSLKTLLDEAQQALAWAGDDDLAWIFHRTAERLYPALRADAGPTTTHDDRSKESA